MAISETVNKFMAQCSISYELVPHPHTYSSHETAEAAHVREDHIAKAVLLKDFTGYAMMVIPASNFVEVRHVRKEFNREFELVDEDELDRLFPDCESGAIPPLGLAYDVETFLDESLTTLANIYFEAGDHENLVHVSGEDFRKLLSGVRHGHYSHEQHE